MSSVKKLSTFITVASIGIIGGIVYSIVSTKNYQQGYEDEKKSNLYPISKGEYYNNNHIKYSKRKTKYNWNDYYK
jgi:hypothetical protein